MSTDVIKPTAQEWIQGFVNYFKHIESEDSILYDALVANVTINYPTTPQPTASKVAEKLTDVTSVAAVHHLMLYLFGVSTLACKFVLL